MLFFGFYKICSFLCILKKVFFVAFWKKTNQSTNYFLREIIFLITMTFQAFHPRRVRGYGGGSSAATPGKVSDFDTVVIS